MQLFSYVLGETPDLSLIRIGDTITLDFYYYLSGYEDVDAGFIVFEGEAYASIRSSGGSAYVPDGGDAPLSFDFDVNLPSSHTYNGSVYLSDFGDGTEFDFQFEITLYSAAASFTGTADSDVVFGSAEADVFNGKGGDDFFEGGEGRDLAIYSGQWSDYEITLADGVYTVKDKRPGAPDGVDRLVSVEVLSFSSGEADIASAVSQAPTSTAIATRKATEGMAFAYDASEHFVDPNAAFGDKLTYSLSGAPAWLKINAATGAISGKPGYSDSTTGTTFTVKAVDLHGLSAETTMTIQVADAIQVIAGGKGPDRLVGGAEAEIIRGWAGDDKLFGKGGNDRLEGGNGNDLLVGGAGADVLIGGKGRDTASYQDAKTGVTANLQNPSKNKGDARGDTYVSIENLTGSKKADILTGNKGDNVIKGGGGADVLKGGGGNDTLLGGAGKDTLHGGDGHDKLYGNAGNDTLVGGKGRDTLEGGSGKDILTGGKGADTFVFRSVKDSPATKKGWDVITDFRRGQGDKIDLEAIDAKTGKGNQSFNFIGKDAFSGQKGELRFDGNNKKTFVYGDVDGDGKADFRIELTGKIDLKEGDFFL